jgi:hypothetical protein
VLTDLPLADQGGDVPWRRQHQLTAQQSAPTEKTLCREAFVARALAIEIWTSNSIVRIALHGQKLATERSTAEGSGLMRWTNELGPGSRAAREEANPPQ